MSDSIAMVEVAMIMRTLVIHDKPRTSSWLQIRNNSFLFVNDEDERMDIIKKINCTVKQFFVVVIYHSLISRAHV